MPTVRPCKEKNKVWKTAAGGIPSCFSPLIRFQSHSNLSPVATLIYQGRNCTWKIFKSETTEELTGGQRQKKKKDLDFKKEKQRNGEKKTGGGVQCGSSVEAVEAEVLQLDT